jgi:hypothetical protein
VGRKRGGKVKQDTTIFRSIHYNIIAEILGKVLCIFLALQESTNLDKGVQNISGFCINIITNWRRRRRRSGWG